MKLILLFCVLVLTACGGGNSDKKAINESMCEKIGARYVDASGNALIIQKSNCIGLRRNTYCDSHFTFKFTGGSNFLFDVSRVSPGYYHPSYFAYCLDVGTRSCSVEIKSNNVDIEITCGTESIYYTRIGSFGL